MAESRHMDECAIVGFGTAQATLPGIAQMRKDPAPGRPSTMEFQVLKHADEHTVLALAAMLDGVSAVPGSAPFAEWAVVAAPRWPGRFGTATAIERYRADGARGVSPLAIPNVCLHSLSGTVSLVFQMRGPNFGVGGGLSSIADGLLAGLGLQLEHQPPGTWVIFSEWDVEPGQVDAHGEPRARALALALGPVTQAPSARRLRLRPTRGVPPKPVCPRLAGLTDCLLDPATTPWMCTLDWGMELSIA
ncbi:MAG TPA: hypothetical protein VNX28_09920 [Gemmataceae bacterium]|nr:hypothetical protein [Gemmataceae bacterium]